MTDRSAAHTALVNDVLIAHGARPDLCLWKANVMAAQTRAGAWVQAGTPGQADIIGIRAPSGQLIGLEIKTGSGTQSREQKSWQAMVERFGGAYCVVRSVQDATAFLGPA